MPICTKWKNDWDIPTLFVLCNSCTITSFPHLISYGATIAPSLDDSYVTPIEIKKTHLPQKVISARHHYLGRNTYAYFSFSTWVSGICNIIKKLYETLQAYLKRNGAKVSRLRASSHSIRYLISSAKAMMLTSHVTVSSTSAIPTQSTRHKEQNIATTVSVRLVFYFLPFKQNIFLCSWHHHYLHFLSDCGVRVLRPLGPECTIPYVVSC
jgi:hypothetical protein